MHSIESVRARSSLFCKNRDWQQFHTPTNLGLAMVGEVGEVCEQLQWRHKSPDYASEELVAIGEELSDVFIYATRLCDVCNLDLAKCVDHFIRGQSLDTLSDMRPSSAGGGEWADLRLDFIASALQLEQTNPRFFCLKLAAQSGLVSESFAAKLECQGGLQDWSTGELASLSFNIASIIVILASLAKLLGIDLAEALAAKMTKNEIKYPADRSRGSSAKYTKYAATKNRWQSTLFYASILIVGIVLGRHVK